MELQLLITLINVFGIVMVAWLTYMNRKAIHQVHVSLNSRLSELIEATRLAAHAEGVKEGQTNGKNTTGSA